VTRLELLLAAGLLVVATFVIRATAVDDARVVAGPPAARIDAYLSRAARFGFSGTVLVADSRRVLLNEGYGWANEALRVSNTAGTIFDIGSITKTFTTNAILQLASEGRLGVHDSLRRFFSDAPPDKQDITLHQLMTHTSGIEDPPIGDYDPVTLDSLRKVVFARPLLSRPGTGYNYSNAGITLLAMVIARVTGMQFETFLRDRLLLPSGLRQTGYNLPHWDTTRIAHTYTPPVDQGSPLARLRASQGPRAMLLANGGLLSTTHDLYRWELALRGGGAVPDDAIARQFAVQFERSPRLGVGYDWEIERDSAGRPVSFSHGSDAPSVGLNGEFHRYLSDGAVIITLANNRLNGASTRHFVVPNVRKLLRDSAVVMPPQVAGASRSTLEAFEGRYRAGDDSSLFLIERRGDHLAISAQGSTALDIFNARQGPEATAQARAHDAGAARLLRALATGDSSGLSALLGSPREANELLMAWKAAAAARGGLRQYAVLGTFRLDRRAFLSTVRLRFGRETVTVRFEWAGERPVTHSGDLNAPLLAGPFRVSPIPYAVVWPNWWVTPDGLTSFDLLSGSPMSARPQAVVDGRYQTLEFAVGGRTLLARRRP
jgi:CubicO group peptidase (beta-lactamase class C family)